jgi:signal transduction histidine kinase/ligand-binding sensor domain-containing protein
LNNFATLLSARVAGLGIALFASSGYALDPARSVDQYAHASWTVPYGQINAITQSADGYLWVGTESGLIRFDGRAFQRQDSGDLGLDSILGLAPDARGGLWVRSLDPSLLRYQDAKFVASSLVPNHDPRLTAIATGRDGAALVVGKWDGFAALKNGSFRITVPRAALPPSPVTSIAEAPSGDVWLGTVDAGLVLVHAGKVVPIVHGLPSPRVTALLAAIDGQVYIGTDRGLVRASGTSLSRDGIPQALRDLSIVAILQDRDRNIWIGLEHGLARLDPEGNATLRSGRSITALFEDREGDIWAGSTDQLERIQETPFATYHSAIEKGGPVYADAHGDVWFVSGPGAIERVRNGTHFEFRLPAVRDDQIYSIAGDADDLWLGLERNGLAHVTIRGDVAELKTYPQSSPVYVVFQSRDHSVWLGTVGGGALHFQNGQFKRFTIRDGLASNVVFSISEGPDGIMWFGTPSGLSSFSKGQWRTYGVKDGLPSESIYSTFVDRAGLLWAGTLTGLAYVRDGKAFAAQFPFRGAIFGLAEDRLGSLWAVASDAVFRVDPKRSKVREFGLSDGLTDSHAVRRNPTISTDLSGVIWISRPGGVASVSPERVNQAAAPPTVVHVSQVFVNGNLYDFHSSPHLDSDTKRVAIQYNGLNLASPERVRYRFRLDGFDHDWNEAGSGREAVYTNLGPGTYLFHVLASNGDQSWDSTEASLSFTIIPVFWRTVWFWAVCAVAGIVLSIALYRMRIHRMTRQVNLQFEARFAERHRIARDLHDTLLQSFQGLLLRFQAVENMLPGRPFQAKEALEIAIQHAARAITEGRDAVQELRQDEGRIALVDTLTSLGDELRLTDDPSLPSYRVLLEGTPRELQPHLQEELYRISREAVANAFRHARATHIELDLRYSSRVLRLRVRDDGVGIDQEVLAKGGREGHWGLTGLRERATAIRAELEIWSERNRGTVEFRVPASVAYLPLEKPESR